MANRKPKNVKRLIGIISKDVTENAYHGGGSGEVEAVAIALSPLKASNKIRLDFAKIAPSNYTDYGSCDTIVTATYVKNEQAPVAKNYFVSNLQSASVSDYIGSDTESLQILVRAYLNETKTQVCVEIGSKDNSEAEHEYGDIIPSVVIYSSETPIEMEIDDDFPAEIVSQFASIEFDVPESFVGKYLELNYQYEDNNPIEIL